MAGALLTLDQMIHFYGPEHFPLPESRLRELLANPDPSQWALGHLLAACNPFSEGRPEAARDYLQQVRAETKTLSAPIIAILIWLHRRMGDPQGAAYACVDYARDAAAQGLFDLALEACSAAIFLDQAGRFEITRSPEKTLPLVALYEQAARSMTDLPRRTIHGEGKRRVALITGNLVDHAVAYSRRVLNFARYADRTRYDLFVYSTENLTQREQPLFPFGLDNGGSRECAPVCMQTLKALDVPVYLAPRNLTATQTAAAVIQQLEADRIDFAVFQTGMASPIDWLVARRSPVLVKAGIHIGSSPFNTGFDLYFFDNPVNIEREKAFWTDAMGERIVLTSGVDIELLRKSPSVSRCELKIPSNAVVIGTVSNHLGERMSEAFCELLARVLQANPSAYYLGIGSPPDEERIKLFRDGEVLEQMLFPGPVRAASAVLKIMDIYANEFPLGGSESVKEAIACGIPVVALAWSDAHAESAGATIAGPEFGIPERNVTAYEALLNHWITDAGARRQAGSQLATRAEEHYSIRTYVADVFEHLEQVAGRKD